MHPPSPLELLHPDGVAGRAVVLGERLPDALRRGLPEGGQGEAGLVAVAPSDGARPRETAAAAVRALAPDGIVYAARRGRGLVGALAAEGLEVAGGFAQLPRAEDVRLVASAESRVLRHALGTLLPPTPRRRLAAAAAPVLRPSAVVLRRPGGRPPLEWLRRLVPEADAGRVILVAAWRPEASTLVHVFAEGRGPPVAVAKVGGREGEGEALATVAASARVDGVATPVPLGTGRVGAAHVLVESAVSGRPLSRELARHPHRVGGTVERIAGWLEAWNRATLAPGAFTRDAVRERLLPSARELAQLLPGAAGYEAWLGSLCDRLEPLPAVAAHNDLTTANLLLATGERLGVVDWEAASPRDLPLRDLVYTGIDACLAAGDRPARSAVVDDYLDGGHARALLGPLVERHRAALGLGPRETVACVHACFLEHAANEARRGVRDGEFVRIAARLASDPDRTAERIAP